MSRPGRTLVGFVVMVATLTAGGIAYATIPDSGGVIHGCYTKASNSTQPIGSLRVVDTGLGQSCGLNEVSLTWNQQGVRGATGPAGPQGPTGAQGQPGAPGQKGPTGPSGTSHGWGHATGGISLDLVGYVQVDSIGNLPAGRYQVWVAGTIGNNGGDADADCRLAVGGGSSFAEIGTFRTKGGSYSTPFSLAGDTLVGAQGSIEVDCHSSDYQSKNSFGYADLEAIKVDAFN